MGSIVLAIFTIGSVVDVFIFIGIFKFDTGPMEPGIETISPLMSLVFLAFAFASLLGYLRLRAHRRILAKAYRETES